MKTSRWVGVWDARPAGGLFYVQDTSKEELRVSSLLLHREISGGAG